MSGSSLRDILAEIPLRDSFPRVDWKQVTSFLEEHPPTDPGEIWLSLAREWSEIIVDSLRADYSTHESAEFILVSSQSTKTVGEVLQLWESCRNYVLQALKGIAEDGGFGKHVVFDFSSVETYYSYICDYDEEGEYGGSEACFIPDYYGHFAVSPAGQSDRYLITHEMTHALIRHLPIPAWIDEGLAELMAIRAVGDELNMDPELFNQHQKYWREFGLDGFWYGEVFSSATKGQGLSYSLAPILISHLLGSHPSAFRQFVANADYLDAGESAARSFLGTGLGDLAAGFLGHGDWSPEPRITDQ